MVYIKVFLDYLDAIEPLGDAERGRLFTALLEYGRTGEVPQLHGNERFIFPMMRAQIDRDEAEFRDKAEKMSEAGRKGAEVRASKGKRGKAKPKDAKPPLATLSKEKDNDYDNDKENDYGKDNEANKGASPQKRTRAFVPPTPSDVREYCLEHGYAVDAERFCDYYQKQGWRLSNGLPVKDWQACLRTWVQRDRERGTQARPQPQSSGNVFAEMVKEGVFEDDQAGESF